MSIYGVGANINGEMVEVVKPRIDERVKALEDNIVNFGDNIVTATGVGTQQPLSDWMQEVVNTASQAKLNTIAQNFLAPDKYITTLNFPNRGDFAVQSICYDTKRNVFYVGMNKPNSESNESCIVSLADINNLETGDTHFIIAGHINDMSYDEVNDRIVIAPGSKIAGNLLTVNPTTFAVTQHNVMSGNIWEVSIDNENGYIYYAVDNVLYRCSLDFVNDTSFIINIPSLETDYDDESNVIQGSIFYNGCFGLYVNKKRKSVYTRSAICFIDVKTGNYEIISKNVEFWMEVEGGIIVGNKLYEITGSGNTNYTRVVVTDVTKSIDKKSYIEIKDNSSLNDYIDEGYYSCNAANNSKTLTEKPLYYIDRAFTLYVRRLASNYIRQTLISTSGENWQRYYTNQGYWGDWKKIISCYGLYLSASTGGVDANLCLEPGLYGASGALTNVPEGSNGQLLNLALDDQNENQRILKQIFLRQGTTNSTDHTTYQRIIIRNKSAGTTTYGNWIKIITGKDSFPNNFAPSQTNNFSLGASNALWTQLFAATATISTSDEREKRNVVDVNEALMRAWGKVGFKVFQFKDAVEKKGSDARLHIGVVAQQVIEAFRSEGLDATKYALLCYDKWNEERDEETGDVIREAGDRYGIRYEEALALECAYQRWRLDKLEAKLNGAA